MTHPETDADEANRHPEYLWINRFEGQVAQGITRSPDGDVYEETWAKVFTDADAIPSEALTSWTEEYEDGAFGRFEEFSTDESGRVWTVSGTVDPDFFSESTETPTESG